MNRYKLIAAAFALIAICAPIVALEGRVVTVSGKVEFQDASGVWKPLKGGDSVVSGTLISTGFKSEATVKLGGSILTIRPLTRMSLTQLVEKEDTVNTELYLEVGTVKAEVNSMDNKKNGFTVKSPAATASVRGTVFEIGDDLVVLRGAVEFTSSIGQTRTGAAGERLTLVGNSVTSPASALATGMNTIPLSQVPSTEVRSPILVTASAPPPALPPASAAEPVPVPSTAATVIFDLN